MIDIFNFKRMINRYAKANSKKFIIEFVKVIGTTVDMNNGGKVIEQVERKVINGVMSKKKTSVRYDNGGFGQVEEDRLICYAEMVKGDKVEVTNKQNNQTKRYMIDRINDYSAYDTNDDGLYIYTLVGDDSVKDK